MNKTTLHWSYLNFKDVPMDLFLYEDLEENYSILPSKVYLKENFITTIPKWLLNVTTLKFIHLAGNNLSAIPEEMYLLENLEFLDVSNNQIRELPKTIGLIDRLQRFNISGNELTELPPEIGALKQLEELNISKNHLKRLPVQLSECQRLNELNLSDNADIGIYPNESPIYHRCNRFQQIAAHFSTCPLRFLNLLIISASFTTHPLHMCQ
ncbi:unnamed protein product [Ceratitis capitata]|uniref:(Mediterranean fruit fly) hypothetical protein n=1 Tax=Ceratitis capitata TaxID=7213 RepID=A0A811V7M7_CERCA|nr:unnamed protein product [Ceratitis capitata]